MQEPTPVAPEDAAVVEIDAAPPPPPPPREVDGELPYPERASWVGATDRQALVLLASATAKQEYFGVVDLETGCLVATAQFPLVARALHTTWFRTELATKRKPDAVDLSSPAFARELAGMHALFAKFGATRLPGALAWSADGSKLLLATTDWMFRSRDGGRTLLRVDGQPSYEPEVSADGRWGAYRRCDAAGGRCKYRAALVPLDGDRPAQFVGSPVVHDVHAGTTAVIFARAAGSQLCVDRADVASRRISTIACARTDVRSDDVLFVSPNARFAAIEIVDRLDPPKSGFRLLSLVDGRVLHDIPGTRAAAPPLDDSGRFAWPEGVAPPLRVHVTDATGDRVVGEGDPLGFDGRGRVVVKTALVGPGPARKLGNPACGLIRALAP